MLAQQTHAPFPTRAPVWKPILSVKLKVKSPKLSDAVPIEARGTKEGPFVTVDKISERYLSLAQSNYKILIEVNVDELAESKTQRQDIK